MNETYEVEIPDLENGENSEFLSILPDNAQESSKEVSETLSADSSEAVSDEGKTSSEYMSVFPGSGFENIPKDATLMDRLAYGGKVALIGMATVFLVLIIIWALCALMGKIFGNAGKKEQNNTNGNSGNISGESSAPQQPVAQAPVAPCAPAVDYSMVAVVASAAIAAYRGEDTVNFSISSINPCGNGAVALAPEVVAQIAASIACLEGKDKVDFTISSIRII